MPYHPISLERPNRGSLKQTVASLLQKVKNVQLDPLSRTPLSNGVEKVKIINKGRVQEFLIAKNLEDLQEYFQEKNGGLVLDRQIFRISGDCGRMHNAVRFVIPGDVRGEGNVIAEAKEICKSDVKGTMLERIFSSPNETYYITKAPSD